MVKVGGENNGPELRSELIFHQGLQLRCPDCIDSSGKVSNGPSHAMNFSITENGMSIFLDISFHRFVK